MNNPQVTIVVTQRERFSYAERSLRSVYENTSFPFKLVYVSAGAPSRIQRCLERESRKKNFELVTADFYLSPNQARNLGMRNVKSRYVVFLDNDAVVTPGWLDALVRCAEETGAWIVGPLYLIGELRLKTIHMAGGAVHMKEEHGKRVLEDEHILVDTPLARLSTPLKRAECDYMEFHCLLARTDVFERIGPLDEKLLSVHEHIDFCLSARKAGGTVYIEPEAVTSYIPPPPCDWSDLPFFMVRWSEVWNETSVDHFKRKWNVSALRFFGDRSTSGEDTIVRWARGQRRLMTGVQVRADDPGNRPESSLEEARLMLALLQSVDRDSFDLTIASENSVVECAAGLDPQPIMELLPRAVARACNDNLNLTVRPHSQGRRNEPVLLRFDDMDARQLAALQPHAFLTLETSPQHYQCWLAVAKGFGGSAVGVPAEAAALARNDARLAGTPNVDFEHRRPDGGYPRIRLVAAHAGLLNTSSQLEAALSDLYSENLH